MDYAVTHVTRFRYQGPVHESVMEVRLAPRNDGRQEVQAFDLKTNPAAALSRYVDAFGNHVHHFDIIAPHDELIVEARMRVRTSPPLRCPSVWSPRRGIRWRGCVMPASCGISLSRVPVCRFRQPFVGSLRRMESCAPPTR